MASVLVLLLMTTCRPTLIPKTMTEPVVIVEGSKRRRRRRMRRCGMGFRSLAAAGSNRMRVIRLLLYLHG